ncbi:AAA family ATPase [uncultured Pseudoalteromonas sp.]|uniref:AAA family ATPase n=1 Tax=uncultured Pseudoalteromonas sp. TaxID=114053 RepID=UPI00259A2333|nr:AAA family ATPase [uncultured Pseudoalteromonas sp.]
MNTNTNTNPQNVVEIEAVVTVDYNEMMKVDAHERFPELFDPQQLSLSIRKHRHPNCQRADTNYVPNQDTLRMALAWWMAPSHPKPLGLVGETGTGKTELLLFIADRLNEPVYIEKITTGMPGERLEGGYELSSDSQGNTITNKRLSQAAIGYRDGGLVILDEVDKANDDLSTSLHLFVEGKPWTLSVFGETIIKHKSCRIAATANTTGGGGSDRYITSQRLDQALRSRFGWLKTTYPDRSVELEILKRNFPKLPKSITNKMVRTAEALRIAALGTKQDGNIDNPLGCVFSTRSLVHWGFYLMQFGKNRAPRQSLDFAFMGSVDDEEKEEVNAIIQRVWADDIDKTLGDLLSKK